MESIVLGAGCFWGVEKLLSELSGVMKTDVGYAGGETSEPTYKEVCTGSTGHIEVVRVQFDPSIIKLNEVLKAFFEIHDPTQADGQHNDIGTQYLSAIFYSSDEQKETAQNLMNHIEEKKLFEKPLATQLIPLEKYWIAEDYHQDYLIKNPRGYMCHVRQKIDW